MIRLTSFGIFLIWLIFFEAEGVAATNHFEKLLAFSRSNQVRVSAVFQPGNESGEVLFTGRIKRLPTEKVLWEGPLGSAQIQPGKTVAVSNTISGLLPELWTPNSPTLYHLEITARREGKTLAERKTRFGFRSFEIWQGQFHLTGQPIFFTRCCHQSTGTRNPR